MSREHLVEVLDTFARVTAILVETSKIKELLDRNEEDNCTHLSDVYNRLKEQVESLTETSTSIKELFIKEKDPIFSQVCEDSKNGALDRKNQGTKPLIKVVDIKKLVDPSLIQHHKFPSKPSSQSGEKRANGAENNVTIVLDSSSDEEPRRRSKKTRSCKENSTKTRLTSPPKAPAGLNSRPRGRRKAAEDTRAKTKLALNSSSSDEEIVRRKTTRKTINLDYVVESDDTSIVSESMKKLIQSRERKKPRQNTIREMDSEEELRVIATDSKLQMKPYVKLYRIPCEDLKEHYSQKIEIIKLKNLTNFNSLNKAAKKLSNSKSVESSDAEKDLEDKDDGGLKCHKKKGDQKKQRSSKLSDEAWSNSDEDLQQHNERLLENTGENEDIETEIAASLLDDIDENDKMDQEDSPNESSVKDCVPGETTDQQGCNASEVENSSNNIGIIEKNTDEIMEEQRDISKTSDYRENSKSDKEEARSPDKEKSKSDDEGKTESEEQQESKSDEEKTESDYSKKKKSDRKWRKDPLLSEKITDDDIKVKKIKDNETSSSSRHKTTKKVLNKKNEKNSSSSESEDSGKESQTKKHADIESEGSDKEIQANKNSDSECGDSGKKDQLRKGVSTDDDSVKIRKNKSASKSDSSDEDVVKDNRKKLTKKRKKIVLSDSDFEDVAKQASSSKSSSESEQEEEKPPEEEKKTKKRKRVKRVSDSSNDDADKSTRKQIRNILGRGSLAETTKKAEAEEKERKARIAEKQKKYNQVYEDNVDINATVEKLVLDFDEKTKKELLAVDEELVTKLKPHQASGIQFMWDACFESLARSKTAPGSGCILAHCMGLGKTLQVIALSHTLLVNSEETKVRKVMVVSPLSTVLNWVKEYKKWLPDQDVFDVYELVSIKQNLERQYQLKSWHESGGVLIIGYDMFRNLSNPDNKRLHKRMRVIFREALVDPGPDLVICDEGHLLKNEKTNTSIAMNRLKTLRRIVLTGTPLQNNLKEYFCMVQFIKPNLLGTYKEYLNRFVNPITNGQYTDSTAHDIQIMRRRSHVLHKLLDGIVQRRDYSVLSPYLPPKHEYVLFLNLTEVQIKLYQHYLDHFARRHTEGSNKAAFLFTDYQEFQRICTHPRVLLDKSRELQRAKELRGEETDEEDSEGSLKDFINDEDSASSTNESGSSSKSDSEQPPQKKRTTRAARAAAKENGEECELVVGEPEEPRAKEWWQEYCDGDDLNVITHGTKLTLLFEILKECEQIGDKILVFSQSLYSLNIIEYFLGRIHDATQEGTVDESSAFSGSWCLGLDYFRLDGTSSCDNREQWCKLFNKPSNTRARLFLISTRAGGLGINLVAANRVIIFDVSWNPSHDIQSIYRIYRFGQTKPSYVYRFVIQGAMEMKIYERQVTKQAISKRVIDEQQIDRHYNQNDLLELYRFQSDPGERPTPLVPKDVLLGELLQKFSDKIFTYHEHQSLLENKEEEGLNEAERKAAWEEFENEKQMRMNFGLPKSDYVGATNTYNSMLQVSMDVILNTIVRNENPGWTDKQIKDYLPTLNQQLQDQLAIGDLTLYNKIQQEYRLQHAIRTQYLREQTQKMLQQQQQQMMAAMMSSQNSVNMRNPFGMPGPSQNPNSGFNPNEVIELND